MVASHDALWRDTTLALALGASFDAPESRSRPARMAKFPVNCELPHIGGPKNMGALFRQAQRNAERMQMRLGIGIAVVLAIGLIWSVAAMSEWVPVVSAG
jgi:hypothetical protein